MVATYRNTDTTSRGHFFCCIFDIRTWQVLGLFPTNASPGDIDCGSLFTKRKGNTASQVAAGPCYNSYSVL
jgi:hypothetical protein